MFRKSLLGVLALFLISGCGGGGSSSVTGGRTTGNVTATYLPYLSSIDFVDCSVPSSPIKVVSGEVEGVKLFVRNASVNMADESYTDRHFNYLAFLQSGKVYRLSLLKKGKLPAPEPVSGVSGVCSFVATAADIDTDRGYVVAETAGSDGNCSTASDNEQWLLDMADLKGINLNGKEFIAFLPDSRFRVEHALFYRATAASAEICSLPGVDNCTSIVSSLSRPTLLSALSVYKHSKQGFEHYYCIDFGSGAKLYSWNGSTLGELPNGNCTGWFTMAATEDTLYGTDGSSLFVYRNGSQFQVPSPVSGATISGIEVLGHYVVIQLYGGVTPSLYYYDPQTNSTYQIASQVEPMPLPLQYKLYYVKLLTNGTEEACIWNSAEPKASPICVQDAYWAGYSVKPSGKGDDYVNALLLVENGKLYSTDLNGRRLKELGSVDSTARVFFYGIGNCLLGEELYQSGNADVLFVDLGRENSLLKVTDTPNSSEFVIY
ncbi:hypothetical protein Theam_1414 [Thermovibrio ammonificans HB-1]|uniref:Lipoprotein n=1 Tax=Thermovibrio ammonificans (strain DSM 15698 / JCM 12110 / HB-1) TaxID=648996 RepID=E8T448_THEA1|nr:hypothetical protein [Thermovibrio ammonificans]ADU97377.1 hypothetical protein Theam_1414 [Thermovibrio ammonificans HB-1]